MRKILLATAVGFAAFVADGVAPAKAQAPAAATPQPGFSVAVTGRLRFHGALINQDGDSANTGGANGSKLSNFDFNTVGRFRLDLTGRNAEGLIYGGRLEVRHGVQGGDPSANANLFFRVANGFIGTPTLGQLRFGSNGVLAVPQMHVGHIMGSIGTGLLDGDFGDYIYQGAGLNTLGVIANSFWYSATGNVNRSTGIGYFSPQFFGFDFGISFAPNEYGFLGSCGTTSGNTLQKCDRTSTVNNDLDHKLRNIFDVMLRYRGTFGPVGIAASGGLRTADTTNAVGAATARKNPTVGIVGAEVTFAGFTVGGISTFGSANRGFAGGSSNPIILPKNGNNDGLFSWQIGARYTFGPFTVGGAYHELRSEGDLGAAADRRERGFGFGGSYALGPGISLFAEYVNSRVRETGLDLNINQTGTQDKVNAQVFLAGVNLGF